MHPARPTWTRFRWFSDGFGTPNGEREGASSGTCHSCGSAVGRVGQTARVAIPGKREGRTRAPTARGRNAEELRDSAATSWPQPRSGSTPPGRRGPGRQTEGLPGSDSVATPLSLAPLIAAGGDCRRQLTVMPVAVPVAGPATATQRRNRDQRRLESRGTVIGT
jgi:hypothetical protein